MVGLSLRIGLTPDEGGPHLLVKLHKAVGLGGPQPLVQNLGARTSPRAANLAVSPRGRRFAAQAVHIRALT